MKYRTVARILGPLPAGVSTPAALAWLNTYGYLLPGGEPDPWCADELTVRALGLGGGTPDLRVAFDPTGTFEAPRSERGRSGVGVAWHRVPSLPLGPGERVVYATVTDRHGAQVHVAIERAPTENGWLVPGYGVPIGRTGQTQTIFTTTTEAREAAQAHAFALQGS